MTRRWYGMVCLYADRADEQPTSLPKGARATISRARSSGLARYLRVTGPRAAGVRGEGSLGAWLYTGLVFSAKGAWRPRKSRTPLRLPGRHTGWELASQCGWVGGESPCRARMRQNVKTV